LGWATTSNATAATYVAGAKIPAEVIYSSTDTSELILYAVWEAKDVTVTFDAGEGTVSPASKTAKFGASITLPTPERSNYTFNGWYYNGTKVGNAGANYTISVDVDHELKAEWSWSCFATGTMITLADGMQKRVEDLNGSETLLVWDFFTGRYVEAPVALIVYHGDMEYTVIKLTFEDGTVLRIIGEHALFHYDSNKFVYITEENASSYVGESFVKGMSNELNDYSVVKLVSVSITTELTGAYSITSATHSNCFADGMLTLPPPEHLYNFIDMGDKLKYDAEKFEKDIEAYGLYTYEDFADYVTYEQFIAFNGAYLKIGVGKGYFTYDDILVWIDLYL